MPQQQLNRFRAEFFRAAGHPSVCACSSASPGALAGSKPLEQWRRAGRWPASYDQFWQALITRQGRQGGTKAMIELLQLGRRHGYARLRAAIEAALELGCSDAAAVQHLFATDELAHRRPMLVVELGGVLRQYERPLPEIGAYDHLLVTAGARS